MRVVRGKCLVLACSRPYGVRRVGTVSATGAKYGAGHRRTIRHGQIRDAARAEGKARPSRAALAPCHPTAANRAGGDEPREFVGPSTVSEHESDTATTLAPTREMNRRHRCQLADALRIRTRFLSLADLDRRTSAFKRVQSLISEMTADLGGDSEITTAQRLLIGRAAIAAVMTEDQEVKFLAGNAIDPAIHATLSNSLRRLLESIGISRVPRDVSPSLNEIGRLIADQEADVTEQAEDEQDAEVEAVIKEADEAA